MRYAFFGTSEYSVMTLETLKRSNTLPFLIITTPDKPKGRGLVMTPSPVKVWAMEHDIDYIQPEKLDEKTVIEKLKSLRADVFIVIAYGKIIPQKILEIPPHGTLNIHASLLPKLRGASPIETAILEDQKETGVTIMHIDEKMDHGPVIAAQKVIITPWPPTSLELGSELVKVGSELLVKILPEWIAGKLQPEVQDETQASYTKKIDKADGEIDLSGDPYKNFLKIQAFAGWPGTYFFYRNKEGKKIRLIIKKAEFREGKLVILRVVPEGKREIDYSALIA